jgi:hypothetical protein
MYANPGKAESFRQDQRANRGGDSCIANAPGAGHISRASDWLEMYGNLAPPCIEQKERRDNQKVR